MGDFNGIKSLDFFFIHYSEIFLPHKNILVIHTSITTIFIKDIILRINSKKEEPFIKTEPHDVLIFNLLK